MTNKMDRLNPHADLFSLTEANARPKKKEEKEKPRSPRWARIQFVWWDK